MSAEDTLIATRIEKHAKLNGGAYPLAAEARSIYSVLQYMEIFPPSVSLDPTVLTTDRLFQKKGANTVHGRITNLRKSGGITFIKVADITESIQLIASKAVLTNYDKLPLLDLGDIIEVVGLSCMSKTSEKSILIQEWKVLTKSHRPPPEKYFGLADQELKYRKRYLDLMASEETKARFILRSRIIQALRNFFTGNGFMEVETSTLNTVSSGANAKPFTTHHNALDTDLFLRIAPELYLKRLLVGGFEKVFEIGRNYRNEGLSTRHNPEFTMIESYQAYGKFPELITQTINMLDEVQRLMLGDDEELPDYVSSFCDKWQSEAPFVLHDEVQVTMIQAVINACAKAGITLHLKSHELYSDISIKDEVYQVTIQDYDHPRVLKIDVGGLTHALGKATSFGERFGILFEYVAEPFLTEDYRTSDGKKSVPVFITEYPVELCPLARANESNPSICDRFELFINGRELANAFQELNDPAEQALRFKEQLKSNDKDPMGFDADYIEALEYGLPPAIGFGMGVDRLVMLLTNAESIKDVILFPTLKSVK